MSADHCEETATELRFTALGPLKAWRAGRELRINRAQDRAVLAVLLAHAGRPVPVGEIIDAVWGEEGDDAPDRAAALPGNVYRLRSALGCGPTVLRHVGKGYRLDVAPERIDRTVFLSALADAATARLDRQPERACSLLSSALDLWSGPALDGVPGPFAAHERRMLAGRREEALRAHRELAVELGRSEACAAGPVLRPFQLPPDLADFTGRRSQLARIAGLLTATDRAAPPLVAVTGPPGAGKSALAVRAAHLAEACFPDGQLYADLRAADASSTPSTPSTPTAPAVLASFLRALGVDEQAVPAGAHDRRELYLRMLADRRVLVVLDGVPDLDRIRPLLPTAPTAAALVVLDEDLPARSSPAHTVRVGRMTSPEAVALLTRVIGPERPAHEPEAARALAAACHHLPRALRHAANRLVRRPTWPISAVLPPPGPPTDT
ncbi:BTAD domain-containing putative transcriptional regulator [Kitasatospora sp. NPDC059646]|uniref:AfsR/SARP family transcriptional regulator n=1 Tax=Kitasatospora sp. NPDC059646 TaxID=3346893 RepID=UPI003696D7CB